MYVYVDKIFILYLNNIIFWRIAAGNKVNGALTALMRRRNVSTAARFAVHNAVLVPFLLYGSETWVLQKKNER